VTNYGIIGIYNSIAALAAIFDVAFSNTISRELAQRNTLDMESTDIGAVFRTLEIFSWTLAAILAVLLFAGASILVNGWIGPDKYSGQDTVSNVRLMALLLLLQAPTSFYSGCLYGMHRHGLVNIITILGTALVAILSIVTVVFISPTIDAFFVGQFIGRLVLVMSLATASYVLLIRSVGRKRLRASSVVWARLWRFAIGMNGIGALSMLGSQIDMIILSRLLPAMPFGYYTIARTVSQSLVTLAAPAYQSAFPQLAKMVNVAEATVVAHTFHRSCQFLSMAIIPPAVVICIFSREVLTLWTHNADLAGNAYMTLSMLAVGSMICGLGYMLSAIQLANGAIRLMIVLGIIFVALIVPTITLSVSMLAQRGAALAWLLVNAIVISISATITFRLYMKKEMIRWVAQDVMLPLAAATLPVTIIRMFFSGPAGSASASVALFLSAILAVVSSAFVLPEGRTLIIKAARLSQIFLMRVR
jgi:O-antigen/teichoic acid export membrane protein